MRYAVKCDDCKAELRRTDSLRESAEGGRCEDCRREIERERLRLARRADYPKIAAARQAEAPPPAVVYFCCNSECQGLPYKASARRHPCGWNSDLDRRADTLPPRHPGHHGRGAGR